MAIIKCKMCGGDLTLTPGSNLAVCQYCGSQQTVPTIDDDKKARLYNRANQYRLECEFDKAYTDYESIVNDQPDEAEAYWGMLLSEYGVEYVDDPKTGKKVPTCHRTLTRSVTANANYKAACRHADAESRIVYEEEAEVLDALQKRVLNASAKEEPYDVFICYKETDDGGNRTADSVLAQDIYDALTAKGLRVFFSRISLEDKLGQDYEPCIFAALNSAKVMLMVTTDSNHCNSVWVKNEWKRYLDFMKNDLSKTLIPVYRDISPFTLPDDFSRFQAQDMGKLGAMQDLARGVEKLTGKNQKAAAGGMTKEEKTMVDAMKQSQKRTKAVLLSVLFAAVMIGFSFVVGFFFDEFHIIGANTQGKILDWFGGPQMLLYWLVFGLCGIPIGVTVTYGLCGKASHWAFLILYFAFVIPALYLSFVGYRPASSVLVLLGFTSSGALLTAPLVYRGKKKALTAHLIMIAAPLILLLASGLI